MYIVGIDIAKRKHEAAVIDGEGTVIIKPFSFTNNCSGYNRLLAMLARAKLPLDEVSFAMEATGHYWLALFTRLQKEGFRVQVINPVQTNSIRSFYIRQAKTDPRDALLIAEVIRFGHFSESIIDPRSLGSKLWLVEVSPAYEYRENRKTDTVLGYRYTVAMPEKGLDKINVRIDGDKRMDAPDGYAEVRFDGLEVFIYWSQGQPQVGARATGIHLVNPKT